MNGNVRADMLRNPAMGQTPPMLGMNNSAAFMQNPAQMNQPQMSMQPNIPHQPMNMLNPANVPLPNNQQNQRMMMQQNQIPGGQQQVRPTMPMRPGQNPQAMMGPTNAQGGPRMAGLNMLPGNAFQSGMPQQPMQNPALRRAPSQNQMNLNAVSGGMSLPVNPANGVTALQAQQLQQLHLQQARQQQVGPRPGGNPGMQPPMGGIGPSPNSVMSSLQQPQSMASQPHPLGLGQNQLQHHPFTNGVGIPNPQQQQQQQQHQHQQQQQQQQHPGLTSSSPRPMPPNGMMVPGPSQGPVNRASMTPDNAMSFMGTYPGGNQFSPTGQRMPAGQYPFNQTSTPPIPDMSDHPRGGPFPTPAQQLQRNSSAGGMGNAPDPFFPPSRPQSQHPMTPQAHIHTPQLSHRRTPQPNAQQQQGAPQPGPPAAHQPSPMQSAPSSEQLVMHPSRPQSRPQSQPQIPNAQLAGHHGPHGQTPRPGQIPLPTGATMAPPGRLPQQPTPAPIIPPPPPSQHTLQQQHTGGPPQPPSGNQQQPPPHMNMARPPNITMPPGMIPAPTAGPSNNQPRPHGIQSAVGTGQALIRLLQFSGVLAGENKNKLQLSWWNELVKEYFTPKAIMKFTLWKDNQQQEAKPFEIGIPILPRFFLVTTQSGVKSMTLTLDGARERIYAQGHAVVECVSAVWTYKYNNGYTVTLRGPLTAHIMVTATQPPNAQQAPTQPGYTLKIEEFEFGATHHEKFIQSDVILGERSLETPLMRPLTFTAPSPPSKSMEHQRIIDEDHQKYEEPRIVIERAIIPGEPVNAFGIPQATMRCLELAESVGAMAELISFADETKLGPLDALTKFADRLRKGGYTLNPPTPEAQGPGQGQGQGQVPPQRQGVQVHPTQQPVLVQQPPPNAIPGPMNGIIPPPLGSQAAAMQQQQQQQQQFQQQQQHNIPPPQLASLYQSAPPSVTSPHPTIIPPPASATIIGSPQNTTSSASNSPQKQHRSIPQNANNNNSSSSSGPASGGSSQTAASPAMSGGTGTTNNTPALANASLKRKGGPNDAGSPTMPPGDQPPAKQRNTRKRGRTGTAGG